MAVIYLRSTNGTADADDGSTWALAKTTLAAACTAAGAGGTVYVSQNHAETQATAMTIATGGTLASPVSIICGNDAAEPPTAVATTATVTTTGTSNITISGACYIYGITFGAGTSTGNSAIFIGQNNTRQYFEDCNFYLNGSHVASRIEFGSGGSVRGWVNWKDCNVKFGNINQGIAGAIGVLRWDGGGIASGGTAISASLIRPTVTNVNRMAEVYFSGLDLSNSASTMPIFDLSSNTIGWLRNCKMHASWTGTVTTGTKVGSTRCTMYNCDTADTNYKLWVEDAAGSIKDDTSVYNDAGVDDGSALGFSWVMAASADAEYPAMPLCSDEIYSEFNDTVGSSKTVTVEIVHDSQGSGTAGALTDKEIWLEVQYLGTSGVPLSVFSSDAAAGFLTTAADQASSSATWTGDAAGWDTQKLSVTFTPQEKGVFICKVYLAKASATVYADPLATIT